MCTVFTYLPVCADDNRMMRVGCRGGKPEEKDIISVFKRQRGEWILSSILFPELIGEFSWGFSL